MSLRRRLIPLITYKKNLKTSHVAFGLQPFKKMTNSASAHSVLIYKHREQDVPTHKTILISDFTRTVRDDKRLPLGHKYKILRQDVGGFYFFSRSYIQILLSDLSQHQRSFYSSRQIILIIISCCYRFMICIKKNPL